VKRLLAMLVVMMLVASLIGCSDDDDEGALRIGGLLPMTGALASYGEASLETISLATSAINSGDGQPVEFVYEDTTSNPDVALEKLRALHEQGIRVVVGPFSSSAVAAVLDFANDKGILLLSPLSTAQSLSIAGDVLFRFTPDDIEEGVAVADLAWADGVRTLIVVNRDDVGNAGLVMAVRAAFEGIGGRVVDGVVYGSDETDFSDEVATLEATLADVGAPASEVGIYLAAFNEVGTLLETAGPSRSLGSLPWYGSNSVALSGELLENQAAAAFAIQIGYPNPILGLRDTDQGKWGPVVEQVNTSIGRDPDAFALAAYDALTIGHQALGEAGEGADVEALKTALTAAADASTGMTGPLDLNPAGDRALATYDFWGVCQGPSGAFTWVRVAAYAGGGDVQRIDATCG
jgi:branched-chain amino acid transport system substrate-binding protein